MIARKHCAAFRADAILYVLRDRCASNRMRALAAGSSRRVLRIFKLEIQVISTIPSTCLLVCNHLSYLDILILTNVRNYAFSKTWQRWCHALFVAKQEVNHWPVLGWFARMAGTIFVHRENCSRVCQTVREIETAIGRGSRVVLFPQGGRARAGKPSCPSLPPFPPPLLCTLR